MEVKAIVPLHTKTTVVVRLYGTIRSFQRDGIQMEVLLARFL